MKHMNKVINFFFWVLTFIGMYLKHRVSIKSLAVRLHFVKRFFKIHKAEEIEVANTYPKHKLAQLYKNHNIKNMKKCNSTYSAHTFIYMLHTWKITLPLQFIATWIHKPLWSFASHSINLLIKQGFSDPASSLRHIWQKIWRKSPVGMKLFICTRMLQ